MRIASHVWYWYRAWNENPVHQLLHWVLFLGLGLLIANHVVTTISVSAIEDLSIMSVSSAEMDEYLR